MRIDLKTPTVILGILLIPAVIYLTYRTVGDASRASEEARAYAGIYIPLGGESVWTVEASGGTLLLRTPDGERFPVTGAGQDTFESGDITLIFHRDPDGEVGRLSLREGAGGWRYLEHLTGSRPPGPQ